MTVSSNNCFPALEQENLDMATMNSKDRWDGILDCKEHFFQDPRYDLSSCAYISPYIASSWKQSREAGINPDTWVMNHKLDEEEFEKIKKRTAFYSAYRAPCLQNSAALCPVTTCRYLTEMALC